MPDMVKSNRVRITPRSTTRDLLWECRKRLAELLLEADNSGDDPYVEVNDLVADCQADIREGDERPDWLEELERLADSLELARPRPRLTLIAGDVGA